MPAAFILSETVSESGDMPETVLCLVSDMLFNGVRKRVVFGQRAA
jgi:hypothetical protein